MIHFSRLVVASALGSFFISGMAFAAPPQHLILVQDAPPAMLAHASQGYLGIVPSDVDNERAASLKLKGVTGTEIVTVDRDGPAGKAGLRVHDVILQMNGQPIAGQEQLRRMLHETPAGRTVTFLISRDGQQMSVNVQLANRQTVEQDAWTQRMIVPAPDDDGAFVLQPPSGHNGSGLFGSLGLGSPSTGVELDTLGSQLADYFGVKDGQGLLVKRVADNSPASRAGLKAGDVITKANGKAIVSLNEWMKMLRSNRGKQVQITLVRNRKEQTVTLDAASGKNRSVLIFPNDDALKAELAQLDGFPPQDWEALQQQLIQQQQEADQQMQQLEEALKSLRLNQFD
ncbi:MAG TPA: PDZ domain-containing protein [Silvibacterium sp.]|nr:PDZ domain-containing protein [Silvibacterium sp.]